MEQMFSEENGHENILKDFCIDARYMMVIDKQKVLETMDP